MSAAASAGPNPPEFITQPPLPSATPRLALAIGEPKLRQMVIEAIPASTLKVIEQNCAVDTLSSLLAAVESLRPDILLLGLPGLSFDPSAALAGIAARDGAPLVIAVNDSPEPQTILKMMRAGAAEFVYPPLQPGLDEALQRVAVECLRAPRNEGRAMGSVIAFVSAKGGCGATTLACHAAAHLRRSAKKEVLLADLDTSAGIAGTLMQSASRYSVDDAFQYLHRMDLKLWKALVGQTPSGVDIIPAPPAPLTQASAPHQLPPMLRFWRQHYEITILDLGHGMNRGVFDVIESIDTMVLVTTNELPALRQARHMIQSLAALNFGANRLRLVVNRMPKRAQIELPELERVMGHPVFFPVPDAYQELNEAYAESKLMSADSDLAARIGAFTEKLTGVTPAAKKARGLFGFGQEELIVSLPLFISE